VDTAMWDVDSADRPMTATRSRP